MKIVAAIILVPIAIASICVLMRFGGAWSAGQNCTLTADLEVAP